MPDVTTAAPRRSIGLGVVLVLATVTLAAACAKVEDQPAAPTFERSVGYVAVKAIPAGKTVRAAKADGSIELEEVPSDVLGTGGIDDVTTIECLVSGRALPAGTVLRRNLFVDPSELGLDRGLTNGTTVDPEC